MTEEDMKRVIAENISEYRKKAGLTQSELAEKINYSDKSVSKWERAEGIPDIVTLVRLSEIFDVTVNELIYPVGDKDREAAVRADSTHGRFTWRRFFVTLLSVVGVWLVAVLTVCLFRFLAPGIADVWNVRVLFYAGTVSFVVWLVLAVAWWRYAWRFVCVTGIVWTAALSVYVTFSVNGALIFAAAGIMQILITVCYVWRCIAEGRILKLELFREHRP